MASLRSILIVSALPLAAVACGDDGDDAVPPAATPTAPADGAPAASTTTEGERQGRGGSPVLVVADAAADVVHLYDTSTMRLTATMEGVHLAEHPGIGALPDGRIVVTDDAADELLVIDPVAATTVDRFGLPGDPVHLATDPDGRYVAVSTARDDDAGVGADGFTLVELDSRRRVDVPLTTGEPGVAIGGSPPAVLHRNDDPGAIEAYPIESLLAGDLAPTSTVAIDAGGHGEAITPSARLAVATDGGIDVVDVGADLDFVGQIPWAADGRNGGRGYYARLDDDGRHAFSYLRIVPAPGDDAAYAAWERWGNDLYVADLDELTATRVELGPGLVYRFWMAEDAAFYLRQHPDGDVLHVVGAERGADGFGDVVATIPLPPLAGGPLAGIEPWEAQGRRVASNRDGTTAFVTDGGAGTIHVVDVARGAITTSVATPTPLSGGGYVAVVEAGPVTDTLGR